MNETIFISVNQWIDFVHFLNKLGPGELAAATPTVGILLLVVGAFLVMGAVEL